MNYAVYVWEGEGRRGIAFFKSDSEPVRGVCYLCQAGEMAFSHELIVGDGDTCFGLFKALGKYPYFALPCRYDAKLLKYVGVVKELYEGFDVDYVKLLEDVLDVVRGCKEGREVEAVYYELFDCRSFSSPVNDVMDTLIRTILVDKFHVKAGGENCFSWTIYTPEVGGGGESRSYTNELFFLTPLQYDVEICLRRGLGLGYVEVQAYGRKVFIRCLGCDKEEVRRVPDIVRRRYESFVRRYLEKWVRVEEVRGWVSQLYRDLECVVNRMDDLVEELLYYW